MLIRRVCSRINSRELTTFNIQKGIWAHSKAAVGTSVVLVEHLQVCGEDVLPEVFLRYCDVLLSVSTFELCEG